MSKRRGEPYRLRRAVSEAAQLHDGAWKDPMAMELIASRHGVPLDTLIEQTKFEVSENLALDHRLRAEDNAAIAAGSLSIDERDVLSAVKEEIEILLGPCDIWLFGSRARRDHRPDSDFDLLVVPRDDEIARPNAGRVDEIEAAVNRCLDANVALNIQLVPADLLEDVAFEWPFMKGWQRDGVRLEELLREQEPPLLLKPSITSLKDREDIASALQVLADRRGGSANLRQEFDSKNLAQAVEAAYARALNSAPQYLWRIHNECRVDTRPPVEGNRYFKFVAGKVLEGGSGQGLIINRISLRGGHPDAAPVPMTAPPRGAYIGRVRRT